MARFGALVTSALCGASICMLVASIATAHPVAMKRALFSPARGILVYALEAYNFSATAYRGGANGNVPPAAMIYGQSTKIYEPDGLAIDSSGKAAIANSNSTVTEYAAGASGDVAPIATITCGGPKQFSGQPGEMAFDSQGSLYVKYGLYHGAPSEAIEVYTPKKQSGCVKSKHILFGANTGIEALGGITVANGMIYAAYGSAVEVFHATGNANVSPSITISGSKTGLQYADGVAVDTAGNLYVANSSDVRIFSPGAHDNAAPAAVIGGSKTGIPTNSGGASGVAVDRSGNIYVAVQNDSAFSILAFAPGSNGNVAPVRAISGSSTQLSWIAQLALRE